MQQNIRITSSRFGSVEVDDETYPVGQTIEGVDDDVVARIKKIDGVTVKSVKGSELETGDDDDGDDDADENDPDQSDQPNF